MKRITAVLFLAIAVCLVLGSPAQAKNLKKHALAKTLLAPVTVAKVAPKAALVAAKVTGKGLAYTVGSVLFAAESGVDVVHLTVDVLAKGTQAEGWKHANVFGYADEYVGYADTGLETAYNFLFHIQI